MYSGVSGELSSMEILSPPFQMLLRLSFQENLVVWKLLHYSESGDPDKVSGELSSMEMLASAKRILGGL